MWFERLMGFKEENPNQVRENIELKGNKLISKINSAEYIYGNLEILSLRELKRRAYRNNYKSKIQISEIIGNIQTFHENKENNGVLFQAASQFNLLEMGSPSITPEQGVGIYENDFTQGPACAIACGAGTIYRNYFVQLNNQVGQSKDCQIDCIEDVEKELSNSKFPLWKMINGYLLTNKKELEYISNELNSKSNEDYINLKEKLQIGIQWNTQVTLNNSENLVSQAYCSALPVAYSLVDPKYWEIFSRFVLEATYEATLYAALENFNKTGNNRVFLTLVGGGAFGNKQEWIYDAIKKVLMKFVNTPLDIKFVSYSGSNPLIKNLMQEINILRGSL